MIKFENHQILLLSLLLLGYIYNHYNNNDNKTPETLIKKNVGFYFYNAEYHYQMNERMEKKLD